MKSSVFKIGTNAKAPNWFEMFIHDFEVCLIEKIRKRRI